MVLPIDSIVVAASLDAAELRGGVAALDSCVCPDP